MKFNLKVLFTLDSEQNKPLKGIKLFNGLLTLLLLGGVLFIGFNRLGYSLSWGAILPYKTNLIKGFFVTLLISLISLILSSLFGILLAFMQRSHILIIRYIGKSFIEIIRGSPLLVQILIFYYVIANALGINNRYLAGVVIMSIFSSAYIAEIIRAGIDSVGKSQLESARSIGLTKGQTYRFIIFPQVIKNSLPPLAGQFASLIKDSSLLSIIAIKEFTMAAREVNAVTYSTLETYIPLALGYLILTIPISMLTKRLERKFTYDT